ncbi:rhomboid family intramembrane serine protease [Virgibacillus sediminis]|uniref:Rhomboid family intramembrane serine protease n=1 Tax=Virgibacillus sediminis TaxID=202260 RepID=A0ABV7A583_9BACI
MILEEKYKLYQIAYHLLKADYNILYMDESREEIWLEKPSGNISIVVRLIRKGFGWNKHMKEDIEKTAQQMKRFKRIFLGNKVEIHNVYISTYQPADEWDQLKRPLNLEDRKLADMHVYYLDQASSREEEARFLSAARVHPLNHSDPLAISEKVKRLQFYLNYLTDTLNTKQKEIEKLFSYGRPVFTYLLLSINIIIYMIMEYYGDTTSIDDLVKFGAKYNPAIIEGEWWRILTSMFLHIGFLHLLMNMLAVYYIGSLTEKIYGSFRFLIIYILAGIGGGLASFAFTVNVSAGASGALFGLFGALLFFGLVHKRIFFQTIGMNIIILVGINIVFGLAVPQIDNGAHIGGLVAGFIAAGIVHLPRRGNSIIQILALSVYLLSLTVLVVYGTEHNLNRQSYQLLRVEEALMEGNYEAVVDITTDALEIDGDLDGLLLFQRSYAYIETGQIDLAKEDLEKSIEAKDPLPEAYYNLALIYNEEGNMEKAEEMAAEAYKLRPDNEDFADLYKRLKEENAHR